MSLEGLLSQAIQLDLPYSGRPSAPARGTPAAVLVPVFSQADGPGLLLVRRTTRDGDRHSGQIAFPGGRVDPGDRDPEDTALREAHEETGLSPDAVRVVGRLPSLWTFSSNYWLTPVVGVFTQSLDLFRPTLQCGEIDEVLLVSLSNLARSHRREWFKVGAIRMETHVFEAQGHRVWGATAAVIRNLLDRLEKTT